MKFRAAGKHRPDCCTGRAARREESEARAQTAELSAQLDARARAFWPASGFRAVEDRLHEAENTYSGYNASIQTPGESRAEAKTQEETFAIVFRRSGELPFSALQHGVRPTVLQSCSAIWNGHPRHIGGLRPSRARGMNPLSRIFCGGNFSTWWLRTRARPMRALGMRRVSVKAASDCLVRKRKHERFASGRKLRMQCRGERDPVRRPGAHLQRIHSDAYIVDTVERAWELSNAIRGWFSLPAQLKSFAGTSSVGWHEALDRFRLKREIRELDRKMIRRPPRRAIARRPG